MRLASVLSLGLLLGLGLFVLACESDDGIQGGGSSKSCDAGETKACGCTDGTTSSKVCGDDDRWKACACGVPDTTPVDPYADVDDGKETTVPVDSTLCELACQGKQCGPDGCGGSCGQCPAGMSCSDFECVSGETTACGEFMDCIRGCYELFAESGSPDGCDETTCPVPQDELDALMPIMECMGTECPGEEPDPSCVLAAFDGACAGLIETCKGGGSTCQPACGDRDCGDDGCGGSCGSCDDGASCSDGYCMGSECSCDGQTCGPNPCGDSCGVCDSGLACLGSCQEARDCSSVIGCGFMCLMADTDLETCLYDYCAPDSQYDPDSFFGVVFCLDNNCGHPVDAGCIETQLSTDSECSKYMESCVSMAMD